ncbi:MULTISPECIES: hypothetical protein [unclassified Haloferax]|uniref:hypothetical protein n=1 Tax=Haloferax TaxID=2251 RepID=UPI0002B07179|nr:MULTISPECIES: hypothetical protein [unclassified Haloferax]ELZ54760.1 hypothetical protein C460_17503 [Haloferax sp. ATCC BAA-646]ELZ65872.1 hypothetical protein C458_12811 [Haloferax sp. ATCC BAA-644]ELZ66211.1 hypothetical protein C459_04898 [Haloferax sp. ATCC BAA-645]
MSDDGRPDADADVDTDADAGADAGADTDGDTEEVDWEMAPDSNADFPADPERVAFLREIADDIYGESSESRQVSAILYRVSDLYDPDGDTSPEEIYLNVRHIMDIKAQGGIDR